MANEALAAGTDTALTAADGRPLAATWFEPPAGPARAVAVVSSAAGVPRGYYRAFAQWLAGRGYAVLTYDYRGIGGSRQGVLRRDRATMGEWALQDMAAALAAAQARRAAVPGRGEPLPLLLVGHSFGANTVAFAPGVERATALLGVAAQVGEPRLYGPARRWVVEFVFRALLPAVVLVFGHLPGWTMGRGAQALPAGVARQWARWALRRGWAFVAPEMRSLSRAGHMTLPVHLWSFGDDRLFAPARAVDALAEQFRHAAVQRHHLQPAEVGAARLGHFGMFRRQHGPAVWQRLLQPLEAEVPALRPPQPPAPPGALRGS